MSASQVKRIAGGFALVVLPFALITAWFWLAEPGAQTDAKRFGRSVRAAISDNDLATWAKRIAAVPRTGTKIDIPRAEWPPELQKLLERNSFATATLCQDSAVSPTGIRFRDGIVGIVIPLNGTIPDTVYFSIHMIDPACSYYAYSLYK